MQGKDKRNESSKPSYKKPVKIRGNRRGSAY